ncbi:MAG TPA: malto-oligosyltrehalose synthase [Opitutaceae bacterium]|nr:malto-oligosyltrehalose synthase [Opitutaceae bacterium]
MSGEWIATYRLQLHAGFPLRAAAAVLPYLAKLGISHVYLSPVLQAARGSTHGYNVTDPTRVSDELGGEAAWEEFTAAARAHGLRVLLDIVPNHMAATAENPWWDDLLCHGPYSDFHEFFDVAPAPGGPWRAHLAPLGRRYGEVLEAGEFTLEVDGRGPRLRYFEHSWPLNPASWGLLAGGEPDPVFARLEELGRRADPGEDERRAYREAAARAAEVLAAAKQGALFGGAVGNRATDPDAMHALIGRQFYALHHWKLEGELVNYRRFFDIGTLAGLRTEEEKVFTATHRRVEAMIRAGELDGLRVDHPDGLRDPGAYFARLRALLPRGRVLVEKILDEEEVLRAEWPVDGTVGYDFLSRVNRLWMDGQKKDALTAFYADFTKQSVNFPAVVRERKRAVVERTFASELERLTDRALALAAGGWRHRDLSRAQVREAIARVTTALPVYRTYRRAGGPLDPADERLITDAVAAARMLAPGIAPAVFDFLAGVLLAPAPTAEEFAFIRRWQQLCPAVAAKGVEDTAFYVYDRLASCNEVGASPSALGIPSEKFHEFCHHLAAHWPHNLLGTSTHDHKRSEDVRARISALTEVADRWGEALHQWSEINAPAWQHRAPDRHAEYLLYQTLVGAWPLSEERCQAYMLKACREAKIRTSWHEPNAGYENSLREFIAGVYASEAFLRSLEQFVAPLVRAGRINSLAQTLIKMTAPGVPDFYQGTELWDLSLVDPDNRRPVDYAERVRLLERAAGLGVGAVIAAMDTGLPKLWLIARTLGLRARQPELFAGDYQPLVAQGARTSHLMAYRRGERLIVAVPRFTLALGGDWRDTHLRLRSDGWRNHFTGARLPEDAAATELFGDFPVALLVRGEGA